MIRRLIPRFACGPWTGDTDDGDGDCHGFYVGVEWLGLLVEVAISRVRR